MSRKAKLTLFSKIVYEKMQRCRKKAKLGKEMDKKKKKRLTCNCKDSRGCGLLKSSTSTGMARYEVKILQTPLSRFKLI